MGEKVTFSNKFLNFFAQFLTLRFNFCIADGTFKNKRKVLYEESEKFNTREHRHIHTSVLKFCTPLDPTLTNGWSPPRTNAAGTQRVAQQKSLQS